MHARRVELDATGPPFAVIRDLKEESIAGLPIAIHRGWLFPHSVSPLICVDWGRLRFQFGFSCGAIVTPENFRGSVVNIRQLERDRTTASGKSAKAVKSPLQKYFCFSEVQITLYDWPSRPTQRGVGQRHERGTGCGGRGSVGREM